MVPHSNHVGMIDTSDSHLVASDTSNRPDYLPSPCNP